MTDPNIKDNLEVVGTNDDLSVEKRKNAGIVELGLPVHGFVTIIKNLGKDGEETISEDEENLLTTDGRDKIHKMLYQDTSAVEVGFNFIAVSSNVHVPVVADTLLLGEITTGGLPRAAATTNTHIDDTNVSTLAVTFTATAIHADVQLSGLFDQLAVGGTLSHENVFSAVADLEIGDTLTVTWTCTVG